MLFRFLRNRWPLATPISAMARGAAQRCVHLRPNKGEANERRQVKRSRSGALHRQRELVPARPQSRRAVYRRREIRRRSGRRLLAARRNRLGPARREGSRRRGISGLDAYGQERPHGGPHLRGRHPADHACRQAGRWNCGSSLGCCQPKPAVSRPNSKTSIAGRLSWSQAATWPRWHQAFGSCGAS